MSRERDRTLLLAERTKYPKIYLEVYWGHFRDYTPCLDDDIIENRNAFIESHPGIKKKKWLKREQALLEEKLKGVNSLLDHNEHYWTPEALLFITSTITVASEEPRLIEAGFTVIPKMYSCNATTYLLSIPR